MKITRIVKRLGRTINTGNYQTLRIEEEIEAVLDENDTIEQVDQKLLDTATEFMSKDLTRIKAMKQSKENSNG